MNWLKQLIDRYWLPTPPQTRKAVGAALAALLVLVVALFTSSNQKGSIEFPSPQWQTQTGTSPTQASNAQSAFNAGQVGGLLITVHVVGQVQTPGVYQLDSPARVFDAIALAGGFSPKADQASLNLARLLNDGEQLVVLARGESVADGNLGVGSATGSKLVNLNRASVAELDTLPGIGATLAARIIDYRTSNGSFSSVQDLGKVAGIGTKLLASLKPLVTL